MASALERFPVKLYPTASESDILFYCVVDETLSKNKTVAYGELYHSLIPHAAAGFETHELVLIKEMPRDPSKQLWFFAADRASQDDYNFSFNQGRELIRDYLVRRSLYYARTSAEAGEGAVVGEFFAPTVATLDTRFAKYGFADDTLIEAPEELRSLYVVVRRRLVEPVTTEYLYAEEFNGHVSIVRTLIPTGSGNPPATPSLGTSTEIEHVNSFHDVRILRSVVPSTALANFVKTHPVQARLDDMPRELLSVNIEWNESYDIGVQDYAMFKWVSGASGSLGERSSDSASSSASIVPEIQIRYRDLASGNLLATRYEFYLSGSVTEAAVLARLTTLAGAAVATWPVFRPESVTISTKGQAVNVRSNVAVSLEASWDATGLNSSGWSRGTSDDFSVSLQVGSVQLPPCIHGAIAFTGDTSRSQPVAATAFMLMNHSLVGSISATRTQSGTAYGVVTPTSLSAVSGQTTIPSSGLYLLGMTTGAEQFGYTKIIADVFDASNLA